MDKKLTVSELVELAYSDRAEFVYNFSQEEFDEVIHLIEDGAIKTLEDLQDFGLCE